MIKRRFLKHFKSAVVLLYLLVYLCCNSGCSADYPFQDIDVRSYKDASFAVCYIDVGQGDCSLIQCGGEYMLIDSGEEEYAGVVSDYIGMFGIYSFKYIVITHPHSDHMGAMHEIISENKAEYIIMPDVTNDTKEYELMVDVIEDKNITVIEPCPGDVYPLGQGFFTILAPSSSSYEKLNDYSVVLKFDYIDTSFLFTGDCEKESEEEMLSSGYDLVSDVIKVSHHGSASSSDAAFIGSVRPLIAVIQVGEDNEYGHPHAEVMELLEDYCMQCYCTDEQGTIIIISDGMSLRVLTEKGFT